MSDPQMGTKYTDQVSDIIDQLKILHTVIVEYSATSIRNISVQVHFIKILVVIYI